MPSWFDENGITDYIPDPGVDGQPGAEQPAEIPAAASEAAPPPVSRPQFDLNGAQVHGRAADTKDPNDLLWLASQQPGFDISSNEAAQRTFQNIIQPMFGQQGLSPQLGGRNLDRIVLPGGRTLDFIGNAANADTSQRRMWVGDSANPGPAPTGGGLADYGLPAGGGPINFGGGGGSGYTPPARPGRPAPYEGGPAGPQRVAGPVMDGGAQAAWTGPGAPPWQSPSGQPSTGQAGAFAAPTPYTPQATEGPTAYQGQPITAAQAQAGPSVTAQQVDPAAAVNAERITAPGAIRADQVQGPQAIDAQALTAGTFRPTTAADLETDPGAKYRRETTLAALQNAAASRGNLRNTNTFQALMEKGGEMASQEFANVDQRRFRDYSDANASTLAFGQANNANRFQAYGLTNDYQQRAALANQGANLQAATTNAGMSLAAQQENARNALAAGTFNAGQQNQVGLTNAGNRLASDTFNSGQAADTSRFNAASTNTAASQNAAQSLAAWQAYQGLNQNTQQFNAARTDTANQNNVANSLAGWQANLSGELGRGNLAIGQRNADINAAQTQNAYDLGRRNIDQGYYTADQNYDLGMTSATNQRDLGFGNIGLGYHQANQSYDLGRMNNQLGWYGAQNSAANARGQLGLGWANYGLNADQQDFGQRFSLANLGYGAATNTGQWAGQYGAYSGNNATGAGNAAASGIVGGANAWTQGLTGAANTALGAYAAYQGGQPMRGRQ